MVKLERWVKLLVSSCLLLPGACDTGTSPRRSLWVGSEDAGMDATTADGCLEGDTLPCPCDAGSQGVRTCHAGAYGSCAQCGVGQTHDIHSKCVPGVYVGEATGHYVGGIPGLLSGFPVDTRNGLKLILRPSPNLEFANIGSGCIQTIGPDGGVVAETGGLITGTLDCTTGELEAVLRNKGPSPFGTVYQKGWIRGTFDPDTRAFVDGTWEEKEPPNPLGDVPGGGGTWSAQLTDAGVPDSSVDPADLTFEDCWGIPFPDHKFPDAGG